MQVFRYIIPNKVYYYHALVIKVPVRHNSLLRNKFINNQYLYMWAYAYIYTLYEFQTQLME